MSSLTAPFRDPAGRWWFRDPSNPLPYSDDAPTVDAVGPYETRADAEEDRRGLERTYNRKEPKR